MNPDRLAELEEERAFLLRSLADLERERASGDVDDTDYATLKDDYTARAAIVLRAIDDGRETLPPRRARRPRRMWAWIAATAVAAVFASWLLVQSSAERRAGDVITGGGPSAPDPTDPANLLVQARTAQTTDPLTALKLYDRVLALDPANIEALTYRGWSALFPAFGLPEGEQRDVLVTSAARFLDRARAADPTYVDAQCFTAILRFRFLDDAVGAKEPYDRCVAGDLPGSVAAFVAALGTSLDEALAATATTSG